MKIGFANKKVEKLCTKSSDALKEFGNYKIVKNLAELMLDLEYTEHMQDLYVKPMLKRYRVHELTGNKKGLTSLRIDYSYRMTLTVEVKIQEDEITIMEVSKHYGE